MRPPHPELAQALSQQPQAYLRLPADGFGAYAHDPIGAWGDAQVIERLPYGALLRPIDPEAYAPVLQAPLPIRDRAGGASLGTLRVGTAVTTGQGGALTVHLGKLTLSAWADDAPVLGRTFPPQPEPADGEGQGFCLNPRQAVHSQPDGPVVLTNTSDSCVHGWETVEAPGPGWLKVRHPDSGTEAWIAPDAVGPEGYFGLLTGRGIGGGGSTRHRSLPAPSFAYSAPSEEVIGYFDGGIYLPKESRPDGWWRAAVQADSASVDVWFPPDAPEPPEREGAGGCSATGAAGGLLWAAGLAGLLGRRRRWAGHLTGWTPVGLRRSGRSGRRTAGRRG